MPVQKATKGEVEYSRGHGTSRCGECTWFERERPSSCTQVQGYIEPHMWCLRFKRPRPGESGP